ncbi:MAG: ABC transporter permease [Promethearchaeota archaeon]
MDSYAELHEHSNGDNSINTNKHGDEMEDNLSLGLKKGIGGSISIDFSFISVYLTLTAHEVKIGMKSRLQMAWMYLCLFYGILILLSTREISALSNLLTFFIDFGTIIAFSTAGSSISGEIGGIADTLLSKSVRRWQYVLAKHTAHVFISLVTFLALIGLEIGILWMMKALPEDLKAVQVVIIISLNALVLVAFNTLGIMLSSFFAKPVFAILGCFLVWFVLIFLFILTPMWFPYSPVVFNSHFAEIIADTWEQPYWHMFLFYGCCPIVFILISIISLYTKDF